MKKNYLSLLLGVCLFFSGCFIVNAAEYIWPVGGDNASDTYIEYGYERRTYNTDAYNSRYDYAPYEEPYSSGEHTRQENHYGLDITGVKGSTYTIVSVSDGKVIATSANRFFYAGVNFADRNRRLSTKDGGGYGNYVVIQEQSTGRCFLYAHLKAGTILVKANDIVKAGQVIATMGSSGDSGHMHVHFEVRPNLRSMTTNLGGSLTATTGFNNETVDPRDYIGTSAPDPVVQDVPSELPSEQPGANPDEVVKDTPAQAKISSIDNITSRQINIYFDKAVTVNTAPTVEVRVDNEVKIAKYIGVSTDSKTLIYKIDYNQFGSLTSGAMTVVSSGGNITNKSDSTIRVSSDITYVVGTLSSYSIKNLYTDILNKQVGDLDLDGRVDASDASLLLSLVSKLGVGGYSSLTEQEKDQYARSDVNGDGVVDVSDASAILQYSANVGVGTDYVKLAKCDLNNDSVVDKNDYLILERAVSSGSKMKNYDIDGNGQVNASDLVEFKYLLEKYGSR